VDGENGCQIRWVTVNISNQKSQIENKGWSCSLELGAELTNPHHEK
jgi:hypothetical protein